MAWTRPSTKWEDTVVAGTIPTTEDWAELSAIGWGDAWEVVGSSWRARVAGRGADGDYMQMSDERLTHRWQREAAAERRVERDRRYAAERAAAEAAEAKRQWEQSQREAAAAKRVERIRELRYELAAVQEGVALREYRRKHPFGVECFLPAGPHGELMWQPVNMRVKSADEALALAEHFTRIQGVQARAVAW